MIPKLSIWFVERIILLSCLLVYIDLSVLAQSIRYEIEEVPYTKELEGFVGTSIVQDSDGFMWFSSTQGLYRYDGANFKRYIYNPLSVTDSINDSAGLLSDFVYSLIKDSEGKLWFANYFVLTRFDRRTETFKHFTDTFLRGPIPSVLEGKDGYLWVGSQNGLSKFDKKTGTFRNFPTYHYELGSIRRYPVFKIYEGKTGILWIRYMFGSIGIFNRETETFENIKNAPLCVHNFLEDRSGRFWITSQNGLYQYNMKSKTFQRYLYKPDDPNSIYNQNIVSIIQDAEGNLWMNTYDGIYQYNENLEKLNFWRHPGEFNPVNKNDLLQNVTRLLYIDNAGTIWFFTAKGLGKLIKRFYNFNVYKPVKTTDASLNVTNTGNIIYIWSWASHRDQSYKGLYLLDRAAHTSTKIVVDSENDIEDFGYVLTDHTGTLWVGTQGRGLYKGIISEEGMVNFEPAFSNPDDSTNLPGLFINHIFEDSNGRIWIDVLGHLPCYYNREQDRIIHLVNNPNNTDKLLKSISYKGSGGGVQEETNSGILLASQIKHGIFAIIPPFIRISEHAVMPTDIIKLRSKSNDDVIIGVDIYQSPHDSLGIIWTKGIWPKGSGFQKIIFENQNGKKDFTVESRIYTVKDGLPNSYVERFLEDDHGNFWLGTMGGGLSKFDPSSETFKNYNSLDGLPSNNFSTSAIKSNDGEMFFGTERGFISFYPDSIRYNIHVPAILITGLKINQQSISPWESPILDKLITYSNHLELSYNQNNISLSYAALSYIQSGRNQYKYKLEGFNDDWIYTGNRTNVDFTNLKPGKYTFRISGSNNDGIWNEEGASIQIIIHRPPWNTIWAYLMYGFILIGIILWYRRFLLNRAQIKTALEVERVEKEKVQELDHMKSRFFANISHEFRTPLTLILGPIEDFFKKKPLKVELSWDLLGIMHRNAKRLQRLINQLLDISRLETGKIKLQVSEGNLEESVKAIILSFLSLAERNNIKYTYNLPGTFQKVYFDSDKVEKILTNLISNAFKFTPVNGEVSASLKYVTSAETGDVQFANIKVSDTGKGIPKEKMNRIFERFYQVSDTNTRDTEGTGIGLALIRELVDLYHGEISVESEVGMGSTFRIKLPVSKEQFKDEEIVTIAPDEDIKKEPAEPRIIQEEPEWSEIKKSQTREKLEEAPVILIVEDNIDLRNYISRNLGKSYQIITAKNGKEGLEITIETIPDLVISDLMMPVMDGMEMCRQLKTDERINHIPVIILTARADRGSKIEGLETGADDYIIKPFDTVELQVRVRNLVEQRKRLREKFRKEFTSDALEIETSPPDQYLKKIMDILNNNLSESEYTINQLADELYMSRTQVFRKVRAITGYTPNDLLRNLRLKKAANLFRIGHRHVAQVMHQVGFNSQSYFGKCFKELYGMNPSEYMKYKNSKATNTK